jgi:hypothetical protein
LSLSGQPDGSTVSFSANPATTSSTVTVNVPASAPVSTYNLVVTGTSGTLTHTASTSLSKNNGNY